MKCRFSTAVAIISVALAGCIVTQPSTPVVTTPAPVPDVIDQARRACTSEARGQGLRVRAVEQAAFLGGERYQVVMRTRGESGPERVSCVYNSRYGVARLEGQPEQGRDILAQARYACINEAQRRGVSVVGVGRTVDLGDMRYQVTLRTSGQYGQAPLSCVYNAKFGAVRIQ